MHRAILGCDPALQIDHINGNGLDNRRCNLRFATASENARNRKVRADSASGIKGVRIHPQTGKWNAHIAVHGKRRSLGCFLDKESAVAAYAKASAERHGEFGRTD